MDQIKSDFKFLTGYTVNFIAEANKKFSMVFTKDNKSFILKTDLESPVIDNMVIRAIADQVNSLTETDIQKLTLKENE